MWVRSVVRGAWGLMFAGLAGAALWAFADQPRTGSAGKALVDASSTIIFLAVAGLSLKALLRGESLMQFYAVFVPAFFAYAAVWWAFCYVFVFAGSDWLGSLFACITFVLVLALRFRNFRPVPFTAALLFAAHTAGSLINSLLLHNGSHSHSVAAKLAWALCFTACLGAGIGYAFFAIQNKSAERG